MILNTDALIHLTGFFGLDFANLTAVILRHSARAAEKTQRTSLFQQLLRLLLYYLRKTVFPTFPLTICIMFKQHKVKFRAY